MTTNETPKGYRILDDVIGPWRWQNLTLNTDSGRGFDTREKAVDAAWEHYNTTSANERCHNKAVDVDANAADHLQAIYLEWLNDWLTVGAFATHYGLEYDRAKVVIAAGRAVHDRRTAENND